MKYKPQKDQRLPRANNLEHSFSNDYIQSLQNYPEGNYHAFRESWDHFHDHLGGPIVELSPSDVKNFEEYRNNFHQGKSKILPRPIAISLQHANSNEYAQQVRNWINQSNLHPDFETKVIQAEYNKHKHYNEMQKAKNLKEFFSTQYQQTHRNWNSSDDIGKKQVVEKHKYDLASKELGVEFPKNEQHKKLIDEKILNYLES